MWDLPTSENESMPPALAGLLTAEPPEKPLHPLEQEKTEEMGGGAVKEEMNLKSEFPKNTPVFS